MILISVKKSKKIIKMIEISGHALFDNQGNDIVCAGVSAIVFGMMNALDQLVENCEIKIKKEANMICICAKNNEAKINLLLEAFYIQLKTIQESYQNYIKIEEE